MSAQARDEHFMLQALAQAEKARCWSSPNPAVGCVLVRNDTVIGRGFTQPAGGAHAEIVALADAGDAAGATAYVTLEPCSHHGRTGPCADALIAAGVREVVVAMEDPNPQVSGAGIEKLHAAGVAVRRGMCETQARDQLAGFGLRMVRGYGRVTAKLAMSLDGRTAMQNGQSKWITGAEARADVQLLRAQSCAIVTGVGTVLADDCQLSVREQDLPLQGKARERALYRQPLRVVLDSQLRTPASARVLSNSTILVHGEGVEPDRELAASGCDFHALSMRDGMLDLTQLPAFFSGLNANEILVESGAQLAGALLEANLLDELVVYMAPTLMGSSARPLFAVEFTSMADKHDLVFKEICPVGQDVRIRAQIASKSKV